LSITQLLSSVYAVVSGILYDATRIIAVMHWKGSELKWLWVNQGNINHFPEDNDEN